MKIVNSNYVSCEINGLNSPTFIWLFLYLNRQERARHPRVLGQHKGVPESAGATAAFRAELVPEAAAFYGQIFMRKLNYF